MICLSSIDNLVLERSRTINNKEEYRYSSMAIFFREMVKSKYRDFDYTKENIKAKDTDHLDLVFILVKE